VSDLPAPLVPAEVDLRGYEYMPYYGDRLRGSGLNTRATDAEFRAAHNLWWSAWKEVPAASLPNDDIDLCKAADLGRDQQAWKIVKAVAMRGFVLCSDGRWYHKVLGAFAIDAWAIRMRARAKGINGAAKKWEKHRQKHGLAQADEDDATATNDDSPGNAPAIEKDSKEGKGRYRKKTLGLSTSPTRGDEDQVHLKSFGNSTPSGRTPDENRDLARKLMTGEIKVGARDDLPLRPRHASLERPLVRA
jgi:hypothetical protein